MNVLGIPVRIMELVMMELMNTVVSAPLDTLDLTVKQVIIFISIKSQLV